LRSVRIAAAVAWPLARKVCRDLKIPPPTRSR